MNTRAPCKRAQETLFSIGQIRHKSTTRRIPKPKPAEEAESSSTEVAQRRNYKEDKPNYKTYGSKIWVYTHLQRNHMVYSLTKSMRNNFSLRQIPFNGKKTVPPALRKDLWHPFCAISFSPTLTTQASAIGLSSYQKLREFRRRHELEWDQKEYMDDEGKNFLNKRQVGLRLCDQKANSVADMAYVFSRLGLSDAVPAVERKEDGRAAAEEGAVEASENSIGLVGDGSGTEVNIEWWDIRDAEFAETWSDNVTHTQMAENLQTNNREPGKLWGRGKLRAEEQAAREAAAQAEFAQLDGRGGETVEARTV